MVSVRVGLSKPVLGIFGLMYILGCIGGRIVQCSWDVQDELYINMGMEEKGHGNGKDDRVLILGDFILILFRLWK